MLRRLLVLLLVSLAVWSADMPTTTRPSAANCRARIVVQLVNATARTPDLVTWVEQQRASYSLASMNGLTFGFYANAVGDNYVSIASGSKNLSSPSQRWVSTDVGKTIDVAGAGVAGAVLTTTIASFTDAGHVVLTDAASTPVVTSDVSSGGIAIWGDPLTLNLSSNPLTDPTGTIQRQAQALDLSTLGTAVVTATGTLTPRTLANRASDKANLLDYASYATGGDWGLAITQALSAHSHLYAPEGIYLMKTRVDVPAWSYIEGSSGTLDTDTAKGTRFVCDAGGPAVMFAVGNSCTLRGFIANGANIAKVGVLQTSTGGNAHGLMDSVIATRCVDYGFLIDNAQNHTYSKCYATRNRWGWGFLNGARNISIIGCQGPHLGGPSTTAGDGTGSADARSVKFITDTGDKFATYGVHTSTSITLEGNANLRFFGGIYETYGTAPVGVFEVANVTGETDNGLEVSLFGVEMAAANGSPFIFPAVATTYFRLYNCELFSKDQNTGLTTGAGCYLWMDGNTRFNGGDNLTDHGITCPNNFDTRKAYNLRADKLPTTAIGPSDGAANWTVQDGALSWDASTKILSWSGVSAGNTCAGFASNGRGLRLPTLAGKTVRMVFDVRSITGAASVTVDASLTGVPWRRVIQTIPVGVTEIIRTFASDEGSVEIVAPGATAFSLGGVSIRVE